MQQAIESQPLDCYSVGWLLVSADDRVVLATTLGNPDDDNVGGAITIPRCVIKQVYGLEKLPAILTEGN